MKGQRLQEWTCDSCAKLEHGNAEGKTPKLPENWRSVQIDGGTYDLCPDCIESRIGFTHVHNNELAEYKPDPVDCAIVKSDPFSKMTG